MTNGVNHELLSIPDVAAYLGMAERTVLQWAQQGKLPAFKLGATWRFRQSEIDLWLESQRSGPEVSDLASSAKLTDDVRPPLTRKERNDEESRQKEARVQACTAYIRTLMEDPMKSVWALDPLKMDFAELDLAEAVRRMEKDKVIKVGNVEGLQGKKVKAILRR
tara:strand:+ start:364 stop:855 length:492 start_codon:yes stop_codon:yes gene_type:complete